MKKFFAALIGILIIFGLYPFIYPLLPHDCEYKRELVKSSGHPEYTIKNMKSVIGEKELAYIIKKYDKHPEKYMSDIETARDQKGVENLTYRAGLHSHTTFSDGKLTPEETLNQAAEYADKVKAKYPLEPYPMIIAITDHFNTQGAIEAIDLIQKNPHKYKNIKLVIGMETSVIVKMPSQKEEDDLHMLVWCINPYEWPFKDMSYNEAKEQWGEEYKNLVFLSDYKDFVKRIQSLNFGLVAIAHPLRYFEKDETIDKVINELFEEYKTLKGKKDLYTEGYYQPYRFDIDSELYNRTSQIAHEKGIYRTGSQDTHGRSIFSN